MIYKWLTFLAGAGWGWGCSSTRRGFGRRWAAINMDKTETPETPLARSLNIDFTTWWYRVQIAKAITFNVHRNHKMFTTKEERVPAKRPKTAALESKAQQLRAIAQNAIIALHTRINHRPRHFPTGQHLKSRSQHEIQTTKDKNSGVPLWWPDLRDWGTQKERTKMSFR